MRMYMSDQFVQKNCAATESKMTFHSIHGSVYKVVFFIEI